MYPSPPSFGAVWGQLGDILGMRSCSWRYCNMSHHQNQWQAVLIWWNAKIFKQWGCSWYFYGFVERISTYIGARILVNQTLRIHMDWQCIISLQSWWNTFLLLKILDKASSILCCHHAPSQASMTLRITTPSISSWPNLGSPFMNKSERSFVVAILSNSILFLAISSWN